MTEIGWMYEASWQGERGVGVSRLSLGDPYVQVSQPLTDFLIFGSTPHCSKASKSLLLNAIGSSTLPFVAESGDSVVH